MKVIYQDGDIEDILENDFYDLYCEKYKVPTDIVSLLKKLAFNYQKNKVDEDAWNRENINRFVLKEFSGHGMYYGIVESYASPFYKVVPRSL
jgi:hypothetical protein